MEKKKNENKYHNSFIKNPYSFRVGNFTCFKTVTYFHHKFTAEALKKLQ